MNLSAFPSCFAVTRTAPTHKPHPSRRKASRIAIFFAVLGAILLPLQSHGAEWKKNTTLDGIAFEQVKVTAHGKTIGYLTAATEIRERPCAREWVHLHSNGELALFKLDHDLELPALKLPAGTWVFQNEAGIVTGCAFPYDIEVQGHLCRGTGGSKGVQVSFYESGKLKHFFPAKPTLINGMLCDNSLTASGVELHENGRVKSCVLADEIVIGTNILAQGTHVQFNEAGKLLSK